MKKTLLLAAVMLMSLTASAQPDFGKQVKPKSNVFSIGLKAGGTISTMTQPDECDLYDASGFGYVGGVSLNARFGRSSNNSAAGTGLVGVGVDLQYKLNSMKTIATDEAGKENAKLDLSYFEAPIYLQLFPLYKNGRLNKLAIEAGAAIAGTMGRKPETLTAKTPTGNVIYKLDTDGSKLKGMDVRPFIGLGYTFPGTDAGEKGVGLNVRYYLGTSKLAENFNSKVSNIEFTLTYKFNVGEF